jgi:WD40 repeat protein
MGTGEFVRTIPTGQPGPVSALTWRPDGEAIASADATAKTVRIWNAQTGSSDGPTLSGPTEAIHTLSFSPDGHRLASLVFDSDPWLWDISTSPPRATVLPGDEDLVTTAQFSADGRRLITVAPMHYASDDDKVDDKLLATGNVFDAPEMTSSAARVWDTDTGELAGPPLTGRGGRPMEGVKLEEDPRLQGDSPIFAAAISPDGQRVLVSTKGLRVHDVATGQPVGEPWTDASPNGAPPIALTFSADGAYAVVGDTQTSALQFRDARTGRPVGHPMTGHTGGLIALTADDNHIVSLAADGWMLWPSPNKWRDELCDKLTANMTEAEWAQWVSPNIDYRPACPSLEHD